jgi:eukaryotic-like serine/threonine-protein kinase
VVNRDLAPGNIQVTADGQAKVLDFGTAKQFDDHAGRSNLLTGHCVHSMKPQYAAPEQLTGEPLRPSLAAARTVTRRHGHTGPPAEIATLRAATTRDLARRLRGDLDAIVLKVLRHEPARRYASAESPAEDLRRHLDGLPVRAHRDTFAYRSGKFVRRHGWSVGAAAVVVLLLAGFAALMVAQRQQTERELDKAQAVAVFMENLFLDVDAASGKGRYVTIREALDAGAGRIGELDEPEVQAHMLDVMGRAAWRSTTARSRCCSTRSGFASRPSATDTRTRSPPRITSATCIS